jgi:xanthine dehydrogenase molybdopterin-binding subunit B
MSPDIDIGQIEGAFVMGMGYHTTESIVFNYEGKNTDQQHLDLSPAWCQRHTVRFSSEISQE